MIAYIHLYSRERGALFVNTRLFIQPGLSIYAYKLGSDRN